MTASNASVTASVSGNALQVTPVSGGTTVLTVSDTHGQSVQFTVQVNTLDITVN